MNTNLSGFCDMYDDTDIELQILNTCSICCICFDGVTSDLLQTSCCWQSIHLSCYVLWIIEKGTNVSCPFCRKQSNIYDIVSLDAFLCIISKVDLTEKQKHNINSILYECWNHKPLYQLSYNEGPRDLYFQPHPLWNDLVGLLFISIVCVILFGGVIVLTFHFQE